MPGVNVAADAEQLPFPSGVFTRVECDAVLEHVRDPVKVMSEIYRVLAPGGYVHLVTPFCHPFHEYPKDYRRFTLDGLKVLGDLTIHGVTKEVTLVVSGPSAAIKDPWGNSRRGLSASTKIDRQDFGLVFAGKTPGGDSVVADSVAITLDIEITQK